MAVMLRAVVMLVVLVGLPSAWIYYGPLPAGAQRVVDRLLEMGNTILAGETATELQSPTIAAPKYSFDPSVGQLLTAVPVSYEAPVALPSQISSEKTPPIVAKDDLQKQLEPHLTLLRHFGASEYTLEEWGTGGQLVRFRCAISLDGNDDFTRQFEAVAEDSLTAVRQVVGEVSSWQNAFGGNSQWR